MTGEYFPLRFWCIKYDKWIILSFHCFKPVKKKLNTKNKFSKETYAVNPSLSYNLENIDITRYKLLFIYLRRRLTDLDYSF